MPRPPKKPRGRLGLILQKAMDASGFRPQEVAAAADISKGTLYKILGGETRNPHASTLRRLCKVLRIDLGELMGAEQLELLDSRNSEPSLLSEMEGLLQRELDEFRPDQRRIAGEAAVVSILEVGLGLGKPPDRIHLDSIRAASNGISDVAAVVISQLRETRPILRGPAVKAALATLLDLRFVDGEEPSPKSSDRLCRLRYRLWRPIDRPKRKPGRKRV